MDGDRQVEGVAAAGGQGGAVTLPSFTSDDIATMVSQWRVVVLGPPYLPPPGKAFALIGFHCGWSVFAAPANIRERGRVIAKAIFDAPLANRWEA